METTLNLDIVRSERIAGYGTNFVGAGALERIKGRVHHGSKIRASVILSDDDARKVMDWMLENPGMPYPFSFTDVNRIVGLDLREGQLAPVELR